MLKQLLILLSFAAFFVSPALAVEVKRPLMLNGHGEVKLAPDMAIVDMGVESQGPTAKAALEANTKNMAALMAMLKSAAIEDKDIQTSNFTVQPRYDDKPNVNPPKIVGYQVSNSVSVIVRKLDNLGNLLDKAVSSGSNTVSNIGFTLSNPREAQDEARKMAVKDALRKANLLSEAAGVKLGTLQSMSEGGGGVVPVAQMARMKVGGAMMADAAPVPVAQGQVGVTADVNMVWELQ